MKTAGRRGFSRIIVYGVVAVVILAIVLWGVSGFGIVQKFSDILPGFNDNADISEQEIILRYSIAEGNVQFRDGNDWIDIESPDDRNLEENFQQYFVQEREISREVFLDSDAKEVFYEEFVNSDVSLIPTLKGEIFSAIPNGDTRIFLRASVVGDLSQNINRRAANVNYGEFVLDIDDALFFKRISSIESRDDGIRETGFEDSEFRPVLEEELSNEHYQQIFSKAIEWRDSVLEKPIFLSYDEKSGEFNVEKIGRFLVVRVK